MCVGGEPRRLLLATGLSVTGEDLRQWRARFGLTQLQTARFLGVSRAHVAQLERHGRPLLRSHERILRRVEPVFQEFAVRLAVLDRIVARLEARMLRIDGLRVTSPWKDPIVFDDGEDEEEAP